MDSIYLDDFRVLFYNNNNTAIVTFYTVTKGQRKGVPYQKSELALVKCVGKRKRNMETGFHPGNTCNIIKGLQVELVE